MTPLQVETLKEVVQGMLDDVSGVSFACWSHGQIATMIELYEALGGAPEDAEEWREDLEDMRDAAEENGLWDGTDWLSAPADEAGRRP